MSDVFGVFGKIPTLGDFLRAGLPSAFVTAWDEWLQRSVSQAKEAYGQGWTAAYMSAPIWRFSLPPGIAGARPVSGVLLPSVDRVGRQYPLTFAVIHSAPEPAPAHFANTELFERFEALAIDVMDERVTRDGVIDALSDMRFTVPPAPLSNGLTYRFGTVAPKTALAGAHIAQKHPSTALWSTILEGDARLMLSHGLPAGAQALGLFSLSAPVWPQMQTEAAQL
ncbi:MAG: type VI secretion system-associated protein TagF [Pseudomonadota bacterium]